MHYLLLVLCHLDEDSGGGPVVGVLAEGEEHGLEPAAARETSHITIYAFETRCDRNLSSRDPLRVLRLRLNSFGRCMAKMTTVTALALSSRVDVAQLRLLFPSVRSPPSAEWGSRP